MIVVLGLLALFGTLFLVTWGLVLTGTVTG